ncbi:SpoIID/LytB domain-containing protein [Roseburia inulinivorans]|uniref:SpoIID/LytB domain-containing protein n=1 Tax=Roseburia inulinivorans TaxID=360807 RepID=UPI0039F44970
MHRKNLAKRINTMLTILLLLLLIPLFLTIFCQKMQMEELLGNVNRTAETEEDADMLFCIVAKEISADAPEECIKAQCVIARTNLKAAEEMGTELPGSMTMGELQELWGDYFSEAEGKIKEAIQETDGETLQYRNHYIYAAYHAVSAGNTRNMEELYPDSDMPYLSGVACYEDAQAPDYLSVLYLDREITIEEKDSAGYVTKAQMNGKSYTGEELRGELGLKSANFNVTELEPGKIRIVTKGHGHGFGLSQYTAQKMAEKGEDYRNILQYFFPGAEVKSVE